MAQLAQWDAQTTIGSLQVVTYRNGDLPFIQQYNDARMRSAERKRVVEDIQKKFDTHGGLTSTYLNENSSFRGMERILILLFFPDQPQTVENAIAFAFGVVGGRGRNSILNIVKMGKLGTDHRCICNGRWGFDCYGNTFQDGNKIRHRLGDNSVLNAVGRVGGSPNPFVAYALYRLITISGTETARQAPNLPCTKLYDRNFCHALHPQTELIYQGLGFGWRDDHFHIDLSDLTMDNILNCANAGTYCCPSTVPVQNIPAAPAQNDTAAQANVNPAAQPIDQPANDQDVDQNNNQGATLNNPNNPVAQASVNPAAPVQNDPAAPVQNDPAAPPENDNADPIENAPVAAQADVNPAAPALDDTAAQTDETPVIAAAAIRMTQFNRLRVYQDRAGRQRWQGAYSDWRIEHVKADWVDENFKPFFIRRVARNFGRWCYVPVGKMDSTASPQSVAANLNGMFGFGTQSPELTPEVRYRSAEDGGDFCLPYSAASAAHHLGDAKLPFLFKQEASNIEGHERQMEIVREAANQQGWTTHKIASVEEIAAFNPLTACADGDMLIMHLKETDGAEDHAVTITLGWIFDANRTHALPLSSDGLQAINYAGIVSATRLTPKPKIAAALAKKRKAHADAKGAKMARVA
ncbi:MAG: hypothetical protein VXX55_05155 [Planctomycetota bacterium]|nr:hypothetical protein [Planctomycetota bacterium]